MRADVGLGSHCPPFPYLLATCSQVYALLSPEALAEEREAALDAFCALHWQLCLVSRGADGGADLRLESAYPI